jgi:hypothetical protein
MMTVLNLKTKVSQTEFGRLVGVSQQAIGKQVSNGVLNRKHNLGQWLVDYCEHLRTEAAGRGGNLQEQLSQARLEESQEKTMSLRQKRLVDAGDLLILSDLEEVVLELPGLFQTSIISAASNIIDAIESKHGIELDELIVKQPLSDALRFVADHVEEFGKTLHTDSPSA